MSELLGNKNELYTVIFQHGIIPVSWGSLICEISNVDYFTAYKFVADALGRLVESKVIEPNYRFEDTSDGNGKFVNITTVDGNFHKYWIIRQEGNENNLGIVNPDNE